MILLDVVQGSDEWRLVRAGVPTASCFDRLLTPKKREPSAQQRAYLCELVAETLLGHPLNDASSGFMERGKELEQEAIAFYEFERSVETQVVGFILRDDRRAGCSPDRLVGEDGGLEAKSPSAKVHIGYLLDPQVLVAEYFHQVQGGLLITGRRWWDVLSYHPTFPPVLVRVTRDQEYLAALSTELEAFIERVDAAVEKVRGLIAARDDEQTAAAVDEALADVEPDLLAAEPARTYAPSLTVDQVNDHSRDLFGD